MTLEIALAGCHEKNWLAKRTLLSSSCHELTDIIQNRIVLQLSTDLVTGAEQIWVDVGVTHSEILLVADDALQLQPFREFSMCPW